MTTEGTRLIRAKERRRATTQTPGMSREEAVRTATLWAGIAVTKGRTFSGWHHHGEHESVIYVVHGRLRLEYGPGGRQALEAAPGDTIYVARGEIHREGNPDDEPTEIVVVRSGWGELVVNVPGPESA